MTAWPTHLDVIRRMMSEALNAAQMLGHRIAGFAEMDDGRLGACCEACSDWVYLAPRRIGTARSSGAALSLRCNPIGLRIGVTP